MEQVIWFISDVVSAAAAFLHCCLAVNESRAGRLNLVSNSDYFFIS